MTTTPREQRRQLERENAKRPAVLTEVPRTQWPNGVQQPDCVRVWVSRDYLVQEFACVDPLVNARLSICRTSHNGERWDDGVSWEELMRIKREIGYGARDAVEIYPADADVVNVANMRHLWLVAGELAFKWRRPGC